MEVALKFPKCLHLEKLLLAYVIVILMSYNFCNHNIFISLKIAVIFKVDKVIAPSCICNNEIELIKILFIYIIKYIIIYTKVEFIKKQN